MKVIVACDSFKGSLSSLEVGEAVKDGIRAICPDAEVIVYPISDGGEGLGDSLLHGCDNTEILKVKTIDPFGRSIKSKIIIHEGVAYIESAEACGLALLKRDERDPMVADSYGVGLMIRQAIEKGYRKIRIGLGGSAVNDGGVGMLKALGYIFLNNSGETLLPGGGELRNLHRIDASGVMPELKDVQFEVVCDVTNPLIGKNGASKVFGSQKGASPADCEILDSALKHYAEIVTATLGVDYSEAPGAGAAGGIGFALLAFLKAEMNDGIHYLLEKLGFRDVVRGADIVITGEGKIDSQTRMGKAPLGVLNVCKRLKVPCIALCGAYDVNEVENLNQLGFKSIFSIVPGPVSLDEAMKPDNAVLNLKNTITQIFRIL